MASYQFITIQFRRKTWKFTTCWSTVSSLKSFIFLSYYSISNTYSLRIMIVPIVISIITPIINYIYMIRICSIAQWITHLIGKALKNDHLDNVLKSVICSHFLVLCIVQLDSHSFLDVCLCDNLTCTWMNFFFFFFDLDGIAFSNTYHSTMLSISHQI